MSAKRTLTSGLLVGALLLGACGSDDEPTAEAPTSTGPPSTAPTTFPVSTPTSTTPGNGAGGTEGWIGGEPDWLGTDSGDGGGGGDEREAAMELEDSSEPASAEPTSGDIGGGALDESQVLAEARAGSIDDNAAYADFLVYRGTITALELGERRLDLTGRIVVTVVDEEGRPVHGATVHASSGNGVAEGAPLARTDTAGRAIVSPRAVDPSAADPTELVVVAGAASTAVAVTDSEAGRIASATVVAADVPQSDQVVLELQFVLDATGSMGDEIASLRESVLSVVSRLEALPASPDVRLAMTVYRDEGDAFVARSFNFTGDVADFSDALDRVEAQGGGDYPEAVDEALHTALDAPDWSEPAAGTVQMMVLLADAPPQVRRQVNQPYTASIVDAAQRGVKIFPVAASGTDDLAEYTFREMAQATGARFVFLSYGEGSTATGDSSDVTQDEFAELPLDELVVALVEAELEPLTR